MRPSALYGEKEVGDCAISDVEYVSLWIVLCSKIIVKIVYVTGKPFEIEDAKDLYDSDISVVESY